ncbi:hypothetical protein R6Q59_025147 [Mikania micrantha]
MIMVSRHCFFYVVIIYLLMTTHLSPANCRLLHPTDTTATATVAVIECTQTGGQMHEFITSATSNTSKASSTDDQRSKLRSLAYKLASGPSKRGPGH